MNKIGGHEVVHALGLGRHFTIYGQGGIYNDDTWNDLLYTMYRNLPTTLEEDLVDYKRYQSSATSNLYAH